MDGTEVAVGDAMVGDAELSRCKGWVDATNQFCNRWICRSPEDQEVN